MSVPVIEIQKLSRTFFAGSTPVRALRDISFKVEQGEFVAIMGHSGSGKSTLLNILGCLDKPNKGTYKLNGIDVSGMLPNDLASVRNTLIGFIFQSYNLLPRTTALENVELPLLYNPKIGAKERKKRATDALTEVGLADRINHKPNELSGGQQQRVSIARALVNNPVVIFADEPTGNLDTRTSFQIMDQFQKLNNAGKTIVIVTHEHDIALCCKRMVFFKDGEIIKDETITDRFIAEEKLKEMPVTQ
ncbi:MAG: ABC transporter ATP-binding protein [Flavobacteriales bacterium]